MFMWVLKFTFLSNEDYQYCKDLFKSDFSLGILGRNSVVMYHEWNTMKLIACFNHEIEILRARMLTRSVNWSEHLMISNGSTLNDFVFVSWSDLSMGHRKTLFHSLFLRTYVCGVILLYQDADTLRAEFSGTQVYRSI